jgi:hypothetical protein
LSEFTQEHLSETVCHVRYPKACDPDTQRLIRQLQSLSLDDLLAEKSVIEARMDDAWANTFSMSLYNTKVVEMERESNYTWIQQILTESHSMDIEESKFYWPENEDVIQDEEEDEFDEEDEEYEYDDAEDDDSSGSEGDDDGIFTDDYLDLEYEDGFLDEHEDVDEQAASPYDEL